MKKMTKKERIDMALANQPIDRIPVSFWRHFYNLEDTPRGLADAMLLFQENYDWDFLKVNARASYHTEDWGTKFKFFKDGKTSPERIDYPVKKISDLNKIKPLNPMKTRVLKDHIDALHYIKKGIPKNMYFVMTVFSPISIVADMTKSHDIFHEYMQEDPKLVKGAIESVTKTFEKFVEEALNVGISGLFYATTYWGTYVRLTDQEFDEFSRPYDMKILSLVKDSPLNILHVCKSNNMLEKLADYPVSVFNWDSTDPTNKNLWEGKEILKKAVIGGIDQDKTLPLDCPEECEKQAEEVRKKMGKTGWILGAGCTFPPETPSENLKALREWVEKVPVT